MSMLIAEMECFTECRNYWYNYQYKRKDSMPYKDKKKQREYQKRVEKAYSFKVSKVSEMELIEFLEQHRPVNTYLKSLVKQEMQS